MQRNKRAQSGFTLVELSIVLVIIGLIIGGVLTGRQIMQNAQVTNTLNAIQAYEAQFQTYVQNYGAMPGDDKKAGDRFGVTSPAISGDGNGTLSGNYDSTSDADESRIVWGALRAAGLVKGAVSTSQPANLFGGIYGFQHGAFGVFTTNVLCLSDVPGDVALALDSRLDDGVSNTGSVQAEDSSDLKAVANSYTSSSSYVVCVKM